MIERTNARAALLRGPKVGPDRMAEFHARHAGATRRAFARGRDAEGRSSYALLAELASGGARVLDLGCGDGELLARLKARGALAIGVDRSLAEVALARAGAGRDGPQTSGDGAVVCGTATALPFCDGAFDLVVSHFAFSVMDEVEQVVHEIERVLTTPGCFAAIVGGGPVVRSAEPRRSADGQGDAHGGGPFDAFERFLELLSQALRGVARCRFGDPRAGRLSGWQELLATRGFSIEWSRHEIDLTGSFAEAWATLSSAYDCMLLSAEALAALERQLAADCAAHFAAGAIPLAMVVWRGVARR